MKQRSVLTRRRVILVAGLIVAFPVITFFSLPLLLAPASLTKSDCIIHAAIDARLTGDRYVAQLYSQGLASKIVCASSQASWELYPGDFAREHLIGMGVRSVDVSALRLPLVECGAQHRTLVIEHLKKNSWKSALLVLDPSITRVSRWLIIRDFRNAGIEVAITFSPEDREHMIDGWWRTHWKAQRIVMGLLNSTLDLLYSSCR